MHALILHGGDVIDGSGEPRRRQDVAIDDRGQVAALGDLAEAECRERMDVTDQVVAPGFVDIHSHSDMIITLKGEKRRELMQGRLAQGITTEVVGNCGLGVFPVDERSLDPVAAFHQFLIPDGASFDWRDTGDYLSHLEERGLPLNIATLVPHNPIRIKVMGATDAVPSKDELRQMSDEVERAMAQGAFGLSFGLIYFPGRFTRTEELIELAKPVAERDGLVAFHQRSGSPEVVAHAIDEILEVGRQSGARVHLSHDHVQGKPGWSLVGGILETQRRAREEGIRLTHDVIPYTGVTTTMLALYPPWALAQGVEGFLKLAGDPQRRREMKKDMQEVVPSWPPWNEGAWATNIVRDCGWDAVFVGHVGSEANQGLVGLSAVELAKERGGDAFDAITDLLVEENGDVGLRLIGISGDLNEEEPLERFMKDPDHAFISDAWDVGRGRPHPGVYGAFPRVLGLYARERGCFTLEEALRKMTKLPSTMMGLKDRGEIRPGFRADLVVFDPTTIHEAASYDQPRRMPVGIRAVFVNGQRVVDSAEWIGDDKGEVIRSC